MMASSCSQGNLPLIIISITIILHVNSACGHEHALTYQEQIVLSLSNGNGHFWDMAQSNENGLSGILDIISSSKDTLRFMNLNGNQSTVTPALPTYNVSSLCMNHTLAILEAVLETQPWGLQCKLLKTSQFFLSKFHLILKTNLHKFT